jgi:hypothetical protein
MLATSSALTCNLAGFNALRLADGRCELLRDIGEAETRNMGGLFPLFQVMLEMECKWKNIQKPAYFNQ